MAAGIIPLLGICVCVCMCVCMCVWMRSGTPYSMHAGTPELLLYSELCCIVCLKLKCTVLQEEGKKKKKGCHGNETQSLGWDQEESEK